MPRAPRAATTQSTRANPPRAARPKASKQALAPPTTANARGRTYVKLEQSKSLPAKATSHTKAAKTSKKLPKIYGHKSSFPITKKHMDLLNRYVMHGMTLPTVSGKTPYKSMNMDATRYELVFRHQISALVSQLRTIFCAIIVRDEDRNSLPSESDGLSPLDPTCLGKIISGVKYIVGGLEDFASGCQDAFDKFDAIRRRLNGPTLSPERNDLLRKLKVTIPVLYMMRDIFSPMVSLLDSIGGTFNEPPSAPPPIKQEVVEEIVNVNLVRDCKAAALTMQHYAALIS